MIWPNSIRANKLLKPPSATEIDQFIDELREEEVHVLACGGGTVTGPANSLGWLRWIHGKRQLLRLAVYLVLSSESDDLEMEEVLSRARGILYSYEDRRLGRELIELREAWGKGDGIPDDLDCVDQGQRWDRLDELIGQVSMRLG